jgi:hypothetical protein
LSTEVIGDATTTDAAMSDGLLQFVKRDDNSKYYDIVHYGYVIPHIVACHPANEEDPDQWHLILNGWFGKTFSTEEIRKFIFFLANAMATSAGFTRFGEYSRPANPFQQASVVAATA